MAEHSSHRATWTEQTEWTWLNTAAIGLHGLNKQRVDMAEHSSHRATWTEQAESGHG